MVGFEMERGGYGLGFAGSGLLGFWVLEEGSLERREREREREMNFLDRKERKPLPWVPTRGEENIHWGECTLKRVVFGDFGVCGRRGKVWVRWLRNLVGVW